MSGSPPKAEKAALRQAVTRLNQTPWQKRLTDTRRRLNDLTEIGEMMREGASPLMAKACGHPGCPGLVTRKGASRCPTHDPGPWGGPTLDERRARTKTPEHRRDRAIVKARDHATCYICATHDPQGQMDHVIPVTEGGTDDLTNKAWICSPCHATKSAQEGARARNATT